LFSSTAGQSGCARSALDFVYLSPRPFFICTLVSVSPASNFSFRVSRCPRAQRFSVLAIFVRCLSQDSIFGRELPFVFPGQGRCSMRGLAARKARQQLSLWFRFMLAFSYSRHRRSPFFSTRVARLVSFLLLVN
jgi:hypothetical protein